MKKAVFILFIAVFVVLDIVWLLHRQNPAPQTTAPLSQPVANYKNGTYEVDGLSTTLQNGRAESDLAPNSAMKRVTQYFGNDVHGDFNGDGFDDVAFILTQDNGGSGTFYYVAAALGSAAGFRGTNAIFLGDRIAPQTTEFRDGDIIVNFATRAQNEPMSARPSIGVSKYFRVENGSLVAIAK